MKSPKLTRLKSFATLALVLFLFTAGAGQAVALERPIEGEFGNRIVTDLLERLGGLFDRIVAEVVDRVAKGGSEINPDGLTSSLKGGSEINPDG